MVKFSAHAFERADERLTIPHEEVEEIIIQKFFVNIGCEQGNNRQHLLFYSPPDHQSFIAIYDEKDEVIITILPLDYHENIAWKVARQSVEDAKEFFIKNPDVFPHHSHHFHTIKHEDSKNADNGQQGYFLTAVIRSVNDAGKIRHQNLGKVKRRSQTFEERLENPAVLGSIRDKVLTRLQRHEYLDVILVRIGMDGEPNPLHIADRLNLPVPVKTKTDVPQEVGASV